MWSYSSCNISYVIIKDALFPFIREKQIIPTSLITDIFVPKPQAAEITYSYYQQLKPANFQQTFLTQQFTKSSLENSLKSAGINVYSDKLRGQRDFTLMFPRFTLNDDNQNIDQILKIMSEFEDPPLVQFYSYEQQQSIKEESNTNEENEEESY